MEEVDGRGGVLGVLPAAHLPGVASWPVAGQTRPPGQVARVARLELAGRPLVVSVRRRTEQAVVVRPGSQSELWLVVPTRQETSTSRRRSIVSGTAAGRGGGHGVTESGVDRPASASRGGW